MPNEIVIEERRAQIHVKHPHDTFFLGQIQSFADARPGGFPALTEGSEAHGIGAPHFVLDGLVPFPMIPGRIVSNLKGRLALFVHFDRHDPRRVILEALNKISFHSLPF